MTPKQALFVEEYLKDGNATAAYARAGYVATKEAARRNAARLLTKADVKAALQAGRKNLAERIRRSVDDVMADIGRVRDDAMQIVIDPDTGASAMLSHKDALKALELEGRHLGAFVDRVEHTGKNGAAIETTHSASDALLEAIATGRRG